MKRLHAGAVTILVALAACRRESPRPARTEPWLASAAVSASSSARPAIPRRVTYTLSRSRVDFELPARRATARGRIAKLRGKLDVDLGIPRESTGWIEIDLESIELSGENGDAADTGFTERALAWLELGPRVPAERRDPARIATFTLRALSSASERARTSETGGIRTSDWTARGDLALHGVRAPAGTDVSLTVSAGDGSAPPAELVIRSRRPLVVSLGTHEIRPRDGSGVLLPREGSLLGESVGREARISFELVFVPQP